MTYTEMFILLGLGLNALLTMLVLTGLNRLGVKIHERR